MRPTALARRCMRLRCARASPAAALVPIVTSPMRTFRGVRLGARRRGWSFASELTTLCLVCCSGRSRTRAAQAARGWAAAEGAAAAVGVLVAVSSRRRDAAPARRREARFSASQRCQQRRARPQLGRWSAAEAYAPRRLLEPRGAGRALDVCVRVCVRVSCRVVPVRAVEARMSTRCVAPLVRHARAF